jgi:hypothetical protein
VIAAHSSCHVLVGSGGEVELASPVGEHDAGALGLRERGCVARDAVEELLDVVGVEDRGGELRGRRLPRFPPAGR